MATTYLTLVNNVLNEMNEAELTSSTFSTSRGIQTAVKKFILKAMHEVYNSISEIPDLYKSTEQITYAGQRTYPLPSADYPLSGDAAYRKIDYDSFNIVPKELVAYNSGGNGRLRLNAAAANQSVSTVKNKEYRIQVRVFDSSSGGSNLKIQVGTSAADTTNLSETITVTNFGEGEVLSSVFTASASTTFITLDNDDSTNLDVDYVRVSENIPVSRLTYMTYDDWNKRFLTRDLTNNESSQGKPTHIYPTQDKQFGLSPVPDKSDYSIQYEYWKVHTDLSAHSDTIDLDDRFKDVIITRAKYYAHILRSDAQAAQMALAEYQYQLQIMRSEYINTKAYMTDTRIHVNA